MNQPQEIIVERSIKRADGSVRPGDETTVVAYWNRNPFRRLLYRLRGGSGKVKYARRRPSPC